MSWRHLQVEREDHVWTCRISNPPHHTLTAEGVKELWDLQAEAAADYGPLSSNYVSQKLISYCGVASSVTVLNSLGRQTDQSDAADQHEDRPGNDERPAQHLCNQGAVHRISSSSSSIPARSPKRVNFMTAMVPMKFINA